MLLAKERDCFPQGKSKGLTKQTTSSLRDGVGPCGKLIGTDLMENFLTNGYDYISEGH